jgi:hypothetical protein
MQARILYDAIGVTRDQIKRLEQQAECMFDVLSDMRDELFTEENDDKPAIGDMPFQSWKSDEHMRVKYRNNFRHYLQDELNL